MAASDVWSVEHVPSPPQFNPSDKFSLADFNRSEVIEKQYGVTVSLLRYDLTGEFFALEELKLCINEDTRIWIEQNLQISQSLRCPNVVACYQSFYENRTFSIIREYMDRGSLADLLKRVKTIPEQYLAAICKQCLQGAILHEGRDMIHWYLKPSNLLINHRGEVKLVGFDITSALYKLNAIPAITAFDTYKYFSPEVVYGDRPDYKSAIWSLGLVLLECATGQYPYIPSGECKGWHYRDELLEAIIVKPPPSAPSNQFSKELCSFISACLQKNPTDRASDQELMEHPFIKMYDNLDIDLSSYFNYNGGRPFAAS